MITRKNKKNRTAFVYDSFGQFEAFISQTFVGAKQASRLTLRDASGARFDVTGAELRVLRNVLTNASRVAANA